MVIEERPTLAEGKPFRGCWRHFLALGKGRGY
jgi:hypothetical protein